MAIYLIRRILVLFLTLVGITFVTFLLIKTLPGDPVQGLIGERAEQATVERIRRELGTDQPFFLQYRGYLTLIFRGDLGTSFYTNRKVLDDLKAKCLHTLELALAAMLFASLTGILLGTLMAVNRGSILDRLGLLISAGGISLPVFWLGLILMFIFSFLLPLLPPSGMGEGELIYLILPASTLGINSTAYIVRITRSSLLEVLSQQYITTARSKGLTRTKVILKHALKNALLPIVTLIGLDFGSYLNGSVLTETIFGWDGVGRYAVEGIMRRDYPVVMGTVLVGAAFFVFINFFVDLIYLYLDPRIRVSE
jgi:ABC-type dipeptide/oligopeptide/nickel transport system permease component